MILLLGYGFIGKALSIRLFDHNIQHRILSRGVENNPPLNVRADIGSIKTTDKVLDDVATVIFFAHSSVPFSSMQDIYGDAQQNILKAIDLFEIFAKKNIRVVYISSGGSVYGMQPYRATELSNPSPISAYGLSKYTVENYLRLYHHNFNLSYDILRLSNVYGVGQRSTKPQGVISAIAQAFLRKESFKIWGDGTAKKDYLYIDDLTEALIRVLSKEASNDTFNIAAGVSYSLNEVVSLLESNFGHSIKLEKANPYDFDVQTVLIDNSKFVKEYEWSPHVCIETGIARAVDWFKSSEE